MYQEKFPVRTIVRIAEQEALEDFRANWKLHHPLKKEQLGYAGKTAEVKSVGFYFGADVLYQLYEVPGIWHERCLTEALA